MDAPAEVLDAVPNMAIVTPSHLPPGFSLPVVARLTDGTGSAIRVIGTMQIEGAGAPAGFRIYRGAGSRVIKSPDSPGVHPLRFRLGTRLVTRDLTVDASPAWQPLAGAAGGMTFAPGSYVDVTGNVTVAAGQSLTFGAGCIVRCGQGVEFNIQGTLAVNGTAGEPVMFAPAANAVWGGVWVHGAGSQIQGHFLILTGGGADPNWIEDHSMHSHKSQQPLLTWSDGAGGAIEDCYIVDNPAGQSTHAEDSTFTVRRCLLQRSVSGGQIHNCNLTWEHNHLVEMPIDDTFVDADTVSADNDGLYVDGGTTTISQSVFGWCKDDGMDAGSGNSSNITVTDCWYESCVHEGMAWSEGGPRTVRDVVTMNNGQGLECGFTSQGAGTPAVNALRVYATGNLNGLRYGDNYDWSYSGRFDVHDSLSLFNADDVFGRHWGEFVGGSTTDWDYIGSNRSSNAYMHLEALPSQGWGATIVSVSQAEHPALPTWDPADPAHLAKLAPFLAFPNLKSGFGVAQETRLFPRASFGGQVTVRLDRPSGTTRVIPWKLIGKTSLAAASETVLLTGELTMAAGRQAADVAVPAVPGAGSFPLLALVFQDSAECVCTGNRTVTWVDLAFPPPPPAPTPTTLVARTTNGWKFLAQAAPAPAAWMTREFDDVGWSPSGTTATTPFQTAEAALGGTAVPANPANGTRPYNTVYFRRAFQVIDASVFASLTVNCMRDDGVVIYLNGKELKRDNMPADAPGPNTSASDTINGSAEAVWNMFGGLSSADLIDGANLLAVEVHQADISGTPPLTDSSDMRLDLELLGVPPGSETPVNMEAATVDGRLQILWSDPDLVLQTNPNLDANWQDLPDARAPFTVVIAGERMFYRLRQR